MGGGAEPQEEVDGETRVDHRGPAQVALPQTNEHGAGKLIDNRYLVRRTVGRGGMAIVYHVTDLSMQRELALKQLVADPTARHHAAMTVLFERELHTLVSLSHPCIIEVYESGADDVGPFYTMELLEGQDLRTLSPLPWQQACALIYDVCSSLALIHSRRLVHRDVTPGNVHCTRDGHAKLIDFGAMVPMGLNDLVIGTPQFIAPEVLHRSNLDARTDLFSLGATLYLALTGRAPYPARDFNEAKIAWGTAPTPPSAFAPGIPAALDALTLALLAVDPTIRPRAAFDVMQRLAGIAGLERIEPSSVPLAYLSTPVLVGREEILAEIRSEMEQALHGRGRPVLVEGAAGIGRSRVLDAAARSARALGATVLCAEGSAASESFGIATNVMQQLLAHVPEIAVSAARTQGVFDLLIEGDVTTIDATVEADSARPRLRVLPTSEDRRAEVQNALVQWISAICSDQSLAILLDDYHLIDAASAALFATLASQLERADLFLLATVETGASTTDEFAFEVLSSRSARLVLAPLELADTERLFESVFGHALNIEMLSHGIHTIARGNPRSAMDMAQHLLDKGLVRYEGGSWTLPTVLEASDLPSSVEAAMRERFDALGPLARRLAKAQALATHPVFSRADYARLAIDGPSSEVDRAIRELVSAQVVYGDGRTYTLAHRGWAPVLVANLEQAERVAYHRALVAVYEERSGIGMIRHALLGELEMLALDRLLPMLASLPETAQLPDAGDLGASELAAIFDLALSAAERTGRNPREINELRRWLAALSVVSEDKYYFRVAPAWHARLRHDSGFDLYQQCTELDPEPRLQRTMQLAFERYAATPEAERAYRPDEAIKGLAHIAGISLAIATSRVEHSLIAPFTASLEPFVSLSPLIAAIHRNTVATSEAALRPDRARDGLRQVYERLGELASSDQPFIDVFKRATAHGIGSLEAQMGISQADRWASVLDDDPALRVNAMHLRRIVRLQQGDWEGAERYRRRAEVLSLQVRRRQMFASVHAVALAAYVLARDLTGLKQTSDRLRVLATNAPGWVPAVLYAEAYFKLICDDARGALLGLERACELAERAAHGTASIHPTYFLAKSALVEALIALDRLSEAQAVGEDALASCRTRDVSVPSHWISRTLALAEAKLGSFASASERLEAVSVHQTSLGISGLHLGATYEARARVAIWAGDERAVETYMGLTAREYRYGSGSALGARYERLLEEARGAGATVLPSLASVERSRVLDTDVTVARHSASE